MPAGRPPTSPRLNRCPLSGRRPVAARTSGRTLPAACGAGQPARADSSLAGPRRPVGGRARATDANLPGPAERTDESQRGRPRKGRPRQPSGHVFGSPGESPLIWAAFIFVAAWRVFVRQTGRECRSGARELVGRAGPLWPLAAGRCLLKCERRPGRRADDPITFEAGGRRVCPPSGPAGRGA